MKNPVSKEIDQHEDIFHQEIIDTFFGKPKVVIEEPKNITILSPQDSAESKQEPVKEETADRKDNAAPVLKPKPYRFIYTLLGTFSVILVLITVFLFKGVFLPAAKANVKFDNYKRFISNGALDRYLVKSFSFEGDAKEQSLFFSNTVKLVNTGKYGWARAVIMLNSPMDFSKLHLLILTKSDPGVRNVILILKDALNNTYRFPLTVSPTWEWKNISFSNVGSFDIRNVYSISIEYGSETVGNSRDSEIYIKEIGIRASKT